MVADVQPGRYSNYAHDTAGSSGAYAELERRLVPNWRSCIKLRQYEAAPGGAQAAGCTFACVDKLTRKCGKAQEELQPFTPAALLTIFVMVTNVPAVQAHAGALPLHPFLVAVCAEAMHHPVHLRRSMTTV